MNPSDEARRLYHLATEAAMHWTGVVDQLDGGHLYPYAVDDMGALAQDVLAMMDMIRRTLASLACDPSPPARGSCPLPTKLRRRNTRQEEPAQGSEEP